MANSLKDQISKNYIRLESQMSVDEAYKKLCGNMGALGAVFDEDRPATLVISEDLRAHANTTDVTIGQILPSLPPGIVAAPDTAIVSFLNSDAFSALRDGARGAMVVDGNDVLGAFTEELIDQALLKHSAFSDAERGLSATDSGLGGVILTPKVVLYCDEFHHRNELSYYNRLKPPKCSVQQPYEHPIRRT